MKLQHLSIAILAIGSVTVLAGCGNKTDDNASSSAPAGKLPAAAQNALNDPNSSPQAKAYIKDHASQMGAPAAKTVPPGPAGTQPPVGAAASAPAGTK